MKEKSLKESNLAILVNAAIHKDQDAITELYNMTYKQAYSLARQMVKDDQEAYDILQEAYIAAFSKLETLNNAFKFPNWFYTIVANKCRDYLRKHKNIVFSELSDEEAGMEFEDTLESDIVEFSPEKATDYSETKRLMNEILRNLSAEQRMCILLYYYEQLSVKEIANVMECSENTVKTRLAYARKKIETEVKNLEKRGTKLYSVSAIPFLLWMLQEGQKDIVVPAIGQKIISESILYSAVGASVNQSAVAEAAVTNSTIAKVGIGKIVKSGAILKNRSR